MEDVVKGIGGEYTGNYTGPYWSNGKVQPSVEWGDEAPQNQLDYLSRQHDSAYARYSDDAHREAADRYYNEEAQKLKQKFPSLAGNLVLYGNYTDRAAKKLAGNVATGTGLFGPLGALGGLIYTAAGNMVSAQKMIDGKYLRNETKDILEYFKTDPKLKEFALLAKPNGFVKGKGVSPELPQPKPRGFTPSKEVKEVVDRYKTDPKGIQSTSKTLKASQLVSKPKIVPMPKIDELSDPVEAQARKFANYANLERKAIKSKTDQINTEIPAWNMHGWQGWHKKRRKKNKIHISPIRL